MLNNIVLLGFLGVIGWVVKIYFFQGWYYGAIHVLRAKAAALLVFVLSLLFLNSYFTFLEFSHKLYIFSLISGLISGFLLAYGLQLDSLDQERR